METKIEPAQLHHLLSIVALLADDKLGQLREDYRLPLPESYTEAFTAINTDANQELMVLLSEEDEVIGTMQLTFIPYLTYQGGVRAQIEAVRVHQNYRSLGLGERLFLWAIARAEKQGAHVLQLTTDKKRPDALRFYEKLGFTASHEGMKMHFNKGV